MRFMFVFILQCKRIARRKSALACFFLLPLLVLLLGLYLPEDAAGDAIQVGVYLPEGSPAEGELWQALRAHADTKGYPLLFIPAESLAQLSDKVAAGAWECGYAFPRDFRQRLRDENIRRLIIRFDSPATSLAAVINEAVSGAMLDICAPDLAISYMKQSGILPGDQGGAPGQVPPSFYDGLLAEFLPQFFDDSLIMKAEIAFINGPAVNNAHNTDSGFTVPAMLRGLTALFLFLFCCLCALWFIDDCRSGFYLRITPYMKPGLLYLPYFCAAALFAGVEGLFALLIAGTFFPGFFAGFLAEALCLLLYLLYLAMVSYFLSGLFRRQEPLAATMPFLLVVCLLFCPILIDLSRFIPFIGKLAIVLPPTFYLRVAASVGAVSDPGQLLPTLQGFTSYLAAGVILCVLTRIFQSIRRN